jgi:cytochrome c oxidase subunit II
MRARPALLSAALALAVAGCGGGWQSALEPHGPQAGRTLGLFWLFLGVAAAVWVLVVLALGLALWRRRRQPEPDSPLDIDPRAERRGERAVTALVALTALVLVVLTAASYLTGRGLAAIEDADALTIRVTGHQWWWEVTYEDPQPHRVLTTANEIHIPVGRPVRLKLQSPDVIHSLWVPNLFGKRDLIPGNVNEIRFRADEAGTWRGQCAEFCGLQHARMALLVRARPPEEFEAWRAEQLRPAEPPAEEERARGLQVFLNAPCVLCHAVRGTLAGGKMAPDLTHLASRATLAAGTLPMSRGNLAAWIVDPHGIKPGVNMPLIKLPPADFQALLSYLEGLR